jgi:hypothetical protein
MTKTTRKRTTKKSLEQALQNAQISIEAEASRYHEIYVVKMALHDELRAARADIEALKISEGILRARLNEINAAAVNKMLDIVPKGSTRMLDAVTTAAPPLRSVG